MTKEQSREAGAVMIAWANGKTLQYRRRDQSAWFDVEPSCIGTTVSWDWDEFEYRIKASPFDPLKQLACKWALDSAECLEKAEKIAERVGNTNTAYADLTERSKTLYKCVEDLRECIHQAEEETK